MWPRLRHLDQCLSHCKTDVHLGLSSCRTFSGPGDNIVGFYLSDCWSELAARSAWLWTRKSCKKISLWVEAQLTFFLLEIHISLVIPINKKCFRRNRCDHEMLTLTTGECWGICWVGATERCCFSFRRNSKLSFIVLKTSWSLGSAKNDNIC